jgi:hypothetical protein
MASMRRGASDRLSMNNPVRAGDFYPRGVVQSPIVPAKRWRLPFKTPAGAHNLVSRKLAGYFTASRS